MVAFSKETVTVSGVFSEAISRRCIGRGFREVVKPCHQYEADSVRPAPSAFRTSAIFFVLFRLPDTIQRTHFPGRHVAATSTDLETNGSQGQLMARPPPTATPQNGTCSCRNTD